MLAISTWAWTQYLNSALPKLDSHRLSAAEEYELILDGFLDLYHRHRALLRFNQFFNIYVQNEEIPPEAMRPYLQVVDVLAKLYDDMYERAKEDQTLRTDIPAREILLATTHLMLAAVTRYAVGLVYEGGADPEKELVRLKNMLLREYTRVL